MSIESQPAEQQLLEENFQRRGARTTNRELVQSIASGVALFAAVIAVWSIDPPATFAVAPAIVCLLVLTVATKVRFYTPVAYGTPIQLAFVPLVFAMPPAIVPVAVAVAFALGMLPGVIKGEVPPSRLLLNFSNAWFSVGPVAVFAIAHTAPAQAGPVLLLAALAAQFLADFLLAVIDFAYTQGASFSAVLRGSWIYGIDSALAVPGLLAAETLHSTPLAALAVVPLLGLLAVFAAERQKRLEGMLELSNAYRGTALVLGDVVEADDSYTGQHCKSVVALALDVADRLGLSAEQRRDLEFGALLHDVGKVAIPKEIINKPGKLDPHEWTIIKAHTVEGQKMLDRVGGFMREVGLIVRSHHERWDGAGYPDGLASTAIPLEARIIACCDTWNAMRTDRPYRKALSYEVAETELRSVSGTQLDPAIVDTLLRIVALEESEDVRPAAVEQVSLEPVNLEPVSPEPVSPDEAGAQPPQLAYGSARQAC